MNYYSLGLDLLIDGKSLKLKKIKLHTNNPYSSNFGIWNRSNFTCDINKFLIKKFNENLYEGQSSSRKISEDYNYGNLKNVNTEENISIKSNNIVENKLDFQILENNNNNLLNTKEETKKKKRDYLHSFETEKSFMSINESNLSVSSNTTENYVNLSVTPNTSFLDVLAKFGKNSYLVYHRCEPKLNNTIKYYCFDGLIFEVLENNCIESITMFKSCGPLP